MEKEKPPKKTPIASLKELVVSIRESFTARVAGIMDNLIAAFIASILVSIIANLVSSAIFQTIQRVYLIISLIALGLLIIISIAVFLYRRREERKQLMINRLRETERELFQNIEADISSRLKGEVAK